ncbi:hypothetical protein N7527_003852 [Penicillium freii]|uniref:Uncharacterized protein n=1 Tax=Penicillium freii TaxID=48697 RepID=A0A101MR66_PENFR|nr:hypothetical protein N7527_003852 [Penicillium freii]KUM65201.1 hypothetical protein ACN42_g1841 [Penicillium freii]
MSYPICAIQFNFRRLITCGGANPVSYGSERSSLNLLVEDRGTLYSVLVLRLLRTQNTACLGKAGRHLADETCIDVLHCRFA